MKANRVAVVILIAGLVAIAAGCGGGSKKSSQSSNSTTQSSTTSKSTTTSGGAEPSNGTPSFANAKNCQDLAGIAAKAAAALGATSGNAGAALNTEANVLKGLANAAPSDIRGDFQTIAGAFSGFIQALQKSGYKLGSKTPPTAAQAAAFEKAAKAFDTPKLKTAEHHLEAWGNQNCKGVHIGG